MAACHFSWGDFCFVSASHLKGAHVELCSLAIPHLPRLSWLSLHHSLCMMSFVTGFSPTLTIQNFRSTESCSELCNVHSKPPPLPPSLTSSRVCFYHTCPFMYCSDSLLGCTLNLSSGMHCSIFLMHLARADLFRCHTCTALCLDFETRGYLDVAWISRMFLSLGK